MEKNLQDYRKSYEKHELLESQLSHNPFELFTNWFHQAEAHPDIAEVNAMGLATCGEDQFPKNRIVLLKSFSPAGFSFYTNYESDKGKDLEVNPRLSLSFFWPPLERQVIIGGLAEKVSAAESEEYFQSRPRGSQLGAWASQQSRVIDSRESLSEQLKHFEDKFEGQAVPRPPHWGGYLVKPVYFEFWQGRKNRLHDRILYKLENDSWNFKRLAP
ncbi:pyridoxamine 5'-phosphate oxidase [Salegentibacter sp. HM20]